MPSPPSGSTSLRRRRLLAAVTSTTLAAAAAGCLDDVSGGSPTTPDDGSEATNATTTTSTTREITAAGTHADVPRGPESYPERPTDATNAACVQFARDFEYARTYNSLHESDAEEVSVSAETHHDRASHDGHYVLARGAGYANYADNSHADWGQAPALYYVSSELVVRVGSFEDYYSHCENVFASDDPSENFAEICEGGDAAFRAYNCHPDAHELSVTVDYRSEDGLERILDEEYFLGTTDAIQQGSVTYRKGTYVVTAETDSGATATHDWTLEREPGWDDPPLCIVVEPTGGLTIRHVPFHQI